MGKKRIKKDQYKLTHDTFFEVTFGMPSLGIAFLKAKLPQKLRKHLDFDKLTVVKPKFRDKLFRETRPDIVYKVPICGTDEHISFYVIIEHKSLDDHAAVFQLWGYVCQLCRQDVENRLADPKTKQRKAWPKNFRLSPVIPIIIHHGNKPFTGETQLANLFFMIPGAKEYLPHFQAILVDLSQIEEGKLPRDPNAPELHVVLLIMKVIFSKDKTTLKKNFNNILKDLKPYSQNPKYRDLIRKLWHYVVYNAEQLTDRDYEALETEIQETVGENNMPTLVQKWLAEGMEKGMEKGKAEGKVEERVVAIFDLLEDSFGEIPQGTKAAVVKITDLAKLRRLTILAGKCKSLAEFNKALK